VRPVIVQIEIGRPREVVWEYMENAEHNPEWLRNMKSCRWITDPPVRVGSRYEQVAGFLGKEVRTSFEVTALESGHLITISSLPGSSFALAITREVDPIGADRCHVTETAGGDPSGFYRVAEPLMRIIVRRNIARAYRELKELLESRADTARAQPGVS
jgi:uncharacterized protein YndB with AHSA1/START domain